MRLPRLKLTETALYHCISKVVNGDHLFGAVEKRHFLTLLREYEVFCGVQVLGYCVMSNHFHVLVEVPARPSILPTAAEVLRRLDALTATGVSSKTVQQRLDQFRALGDAAGEQAYLETFFRRMWDVSQFMKLVKHRFSCWYNQRVQRSGYLWQSRFTSLLVEPGRAVGAAAPYIDLNPIRAAMVTTPEAYPWCGFAAAMAGAALETSAIQRVMWHFTGQEQAPQASLKAYHCWLYVRGEEREGTDESGRPLRKGFKREAVLAVLRNHGEVPAHEFLRCRIELFTTGLVLGSREFVERVYQKFRRHFGQRRKIGAHKLAGLAASELFTLRKFQPASVT